MWGAAVMDLAIWLLCLGLPYGTKAEDFVQEKLPSARLRDLLWGLGRRLGATRTVEVKPLLYWSNGCLLARAENIRGKVFWEEFLRVTTQKPWPSRGPGCISSSQQNLANRVSSTWYWF